MFSSTYNLYQEIAKGDLKGFTVPAFNIRTLTFDVMKALFRTAKKQKVGAFIIEIAQSEICYTNQSPKEYAENCRKAVKAESFEGPVFLQTDHFKPTPKTESLIIEAIDSKFYNIDIDCSALPLKKNISRTNYFIDFIKNKQPKGINTSIGGEVGQIGGEKTTIEELEIFLNNVKGIIKVAVQTGTAHGQGGAIDWKLVEKLSEKARQYGLAGIVQHGASTLPKSEIEKMSVYDICEVHLATGIMDTILESKHFPEELKLKIHSKKDLGPLKNEILQIPQKNVRKIMEELEGLFESFFEALNVENTNNLV